MRAGWSCRQPLPAPSRGQAAAFTLFVSDGVRRRTDSRPPPPGVAPCRPSPSPPPASPEPPNGSPPARPARPPIRSRISPARPSSG
ncbi:MAG: hypothetical protein FP822_01790 [Brevundimonas sp.]|nr:hypothetical protein [Brevundimonas sp.]